MNIHDEMSDNEVLRAAADSLSAIPMASPPGCGGDHGQGPRAPGAAALRGRGPVRGGRRRRYRPGRRPDRRARGRPQRPARSGPRHSRSPATPCTATLTINPKNCSIRDPAKRPRARRNPGQGHHRQLLLLRSRPGPSAQVVLGQTGRPPRRRNRVCSPRSRSTRRPCPRAPSSASATSSSSSAQYSGYPQADFMLIVLDTSSNTCTQHPA